MSGGLDKNLCLSPSLTRPDPIFNSRRRSTLHDERKIVGCFSRRNIDDLLQSRSFWRHKTNIFCIPRIFAKQEANTKVRGQTVSAHLMCHSPKRNCLLFDEHQVHWTNVELNICGAGCWIEVTSRLSSSEFLLCFISQLIKTTTKQN